MVFKDIQELVMGNWVVLERGCFRSSTSSRRRRVDRLSALTFPTKIVPIPTTSGCGLHRLRVRPYHSNFGRTMDSNTSTLDPPMIQYRYLSILHKP